MGGWAVEERAELSTHFLASSRLLFSVYLSPLAYTYGVALDNFWIARRIDLPADLGHDVEHLPGDFAAAFVGGGGFGGGVVAEFWVGVVDGESGHGSIDEGAGFVGRAAGHEGDEAIFGVAIGVVQFGVRADGWTVVGVLDEV